MKPAQVRIKVTVKTVGAGSRGGGGGGGGEAPAKKRRPKRRQMSGRDAMFFTRKEALRKMRGRYFGERF